MQSKENFDILALVSTAKCISLEPKNFEQSFKNQISEELLKIINGSCPRFYWIEGFDNEEFPKRLNGACTIHKLHHIKCPWVRIL